MKVYRSEFKGKYPVGAACALIVAPDIEVAYHNLYMELKGVVDDVEIHDIKEVNVNKEQVIILNDGDY